MSTHNALVAQLRSGTWTPQPSATGLRPLPEMHYVECMVWMGLAGLCLFFRDPIGVVAGLAFLRLISLGPTGAFLLYFSGQSLVMALQRAWNIDGSVLGTTALLTCALTAFHIVVYRKPIDRRAQRDCVLIGLWAILVLWYLRRGYGELLPEIQDRFKLLIVQSGAILLLTYHFAQNILDTRKLEIGVTIVIASILLAMGLQGARFFERVWGLSPIELARAGGLGATLLFLIATSGRVGTQRVLSYGLAAIGLLTCLSQLTRQAIYAIPIAILGTMLFFDRRKKLRMWAPLILIAVAGVGSIPIWYGPVATKLERILQNPEDALSTRQERYQTAWKMFCERPWTGHGYGSFSDRYGRIDYPHNVVLEILCEFGGRGLAVCAIPFIWAVWSSHSMKRRNLSHDEYLGVNVLVAVNIYWIMVSMASYTFHHSCACFPGMYLLVVEWRRIGVQTQSRR